MLMQGMQESFDVLVTSPIINASVAEIKIATGRAAIPRHQRSSVEPAAAHAILAVAHPGAGIDRQTEWVGMPRMSDNDFFIGGHVTDR